MGRGWWEFRAAIATHLRYVTGPSLRPSADEVGAGNAAVVLLAAGDRGEGGGNDLRGGAERRGPVLDRGGAAGADPGHDHRVHAIVAGRRDADLRAGGGTVAGMQGELIVVSWFAQGARHHLAAAACGESAGGRAVLPAPGRRNADERDDVRQAMATSLPAGNLASLSYGARFVNVILLVITGARRCRTFPAGGRARLGFVTVAAPGLRRTDTAADNRHRGPVGRRFRDPDWPGTGTRHVQRRRHRVGRAHSGRVMRYRCHSTSAE